MSKMTGRKIIPLALFCCFLWGSAFPLIKVGYKWFQILPADTGAQMVFAGIRFTIAGLLVIAVASMMNRKFLSVNRHNFKQIILLSLVQTVLQYFFFYAGLANTTGVKGSIITGSNAFLTVLVVCLLFRMEKLTAAKVVGCLVGFAGVVLVNVGGGLNIQFSFVGEGFVFLSALSYAFSSVLIKRFSETELPATLSGWQFFLGGIVLSLVGFLRRGSIPKIQNGVALPGILLLLYLAALSAVAYTLWGTLLKYNPVGRISVYSFSIPCFGVILSAAILGERGQAFGIQGVAALILVSIGIWIVNRKATHNK